jgi:hypothetical protein
MMFDQSAHMRLFLGRQNFGGAGESNGSFILLINRLVFFCEIAKNKGSPHQSTIEHSIKWTVLTNFWFTDIARPSDKVKKLICTDSNLTRARKSICSSVKSIDKIRE